MEKTSRGRKKETKHYAKKNASGRKRKRGKHGSVSSSQSESDSGHSRRKHRDMDVDNRTESESHDTDFSTDSDSEPSRRRHRYRAVEKRPQSDSHERVHGKKEATDSSSYSSSENVEEFGIQNETLESDPDSEESEKNYRRKEGRKRKLKSEGKDKQRRRKKDGNSGDVEDKSGIYRCHLPTTITELQNLKFEEIHLEVIKKTPFWLLFQSLYKCDARRLRAKCGKYFEDIRDVIDAYDETSGRFILGGKFVELGVKDVELIFGVSGGNTPIYLRTERFVPPRWVERCFASEMKRSKSKFVITKRSILVKLRDMVAMKEDVNLLDIARLVHCYLMAAIIAPLKNGSMAPKYTLYLEKFSDICDYDWCGFIVSMLKKQITTGKSSRVGGCTILLPFWLCEHSTLIKSLNQFGFPRFLRWDLRELNRKMSKDRKPLQSLDRKYVKPHPLECTDHEKRTLKSLKKYWLKEGKATQNEQISDIVLQENDGSTAGQATQTGTQGDEDEIVEATISIATPIEERIVIDRSASKRDASNTIDRDLRPGHTNTKRCLNPKLVDHDQNLDFSNTGSLLKQSEPETSLVPVCETTDKQQTSKGNEERVQNARDLSPSMPYNLFSLGIPNTALPSQHEEEDENLKKGKLDEVFELAVGYGVSSLENDLLEARKLIVNKDRMMEEKDKLISDLREEVSTLKVHMVDIEEKQKLIMFLKQQVVKYQKEKQQDFNDRMKRYLEEKVEESRKEFEADYKEKLRELSDELATLREENTGLKERLTNPTPTQLLEDPNTLARIDAVIDLKVVMEENQKLAEKAARLEGTMEDVLEVEMYNADGACVLPSLENKLKNNPITPNSIVKTVKARTINDDRKLKAVSPQPTTAEIIDLQRIGEPENEDPPAVFRWDETFDAVLKTTSYFKTVIKECYNQSGVRYKVWSDKPEWIMVTIKDIFDILHHERLSDQVIDCWGKLLKTVTKGVIPESERVIIMSGKCWDLIANKDNVTATTFDTLVNDVLNEVEENSVVLLPLLAKGYRAGDHWTLLILNLDNCEWSFYNPLRSRPRSTDHHLNNSLFLLDYVEHYLRERFRIKYPNHTLLKGPLKKPIPSLGLQQKAGSLDCGIVVCNHIEKIILNKGMETGKLTEDEAGDFRKRMVEYFLEPLLIVIT